MRSLMMTLSLSLFATMGFAQEQSSGLQPLLTGDDSRGWEGVGRLNIAGQSMCTGALIAPDIVLTAAHCLYDKERHTRFQAEDIEFLAGLRQGRATAYRWVKAAVPHPGYVFTASGEGQVRNDIAILMLERPIDNTSITPFEVDSRPMKGAEVGVVSYAHDRAESPSLQETCHVLARQWGTLVLSCDVDFGSSGAPVFVTEDGVSRIVSVVSAKAEFDNRSVAIATALEGPLEELLATVTAVPSTPTATEPQVRRLDLSQSRGNTGAKFVRP